ncbi:MAG: Zn-ribbon domain-containing OB-fold protein [Anaerolineae bacterium]|nr:Zn-ribbon domain-containing OB-fold protein [Anaerolineae bacterium]
MALQLPREWRRRAERYRLFGGRCLGCGRISPSLRPICPACQDDRMEEVELSGRGEVYSFAVMYKAPEGFEQDIPYVVALVKLEEGPVITAQITDVAVDDVRVGMPVESVLRQWRQHGPDGHIVYGYKFRPAQRP